jgi:hydroxymethylpyrimidine/phosphomethylpyrimidine kinase
MGKPRLLRLLFRRNEGTFGFSLQEVKGGHLTDDAVEVLYDGSSFNYLKGRRIDTKNTHGTGCTFSSAITAHLAMGNTVLEAVTLSKDYINGAIEHSIELGQGFGPTGHFYDLYRKAGMVIY